MVVRRHAGGAYSRPTHTSGALDFAAPALQVAAFSSGLPPAVQGEPLGTPDQPIGGVTNVGNFGKSVIVDESGLTVTGGAVTVVNPGGTVVIDGLSNMFKIVATGTLSRSFPVPSSVVYQSVQLTALGTGHTTPAQANWSVAAGSEVHNWGGFSTQLYSDSAGGGNMGWLLSGLTWVSGGYQYAGLHLQSGATNYSSVTGYGRYYVFKEAGI